jgi:S-DNA-T family DNA segregation ATPase FtsK/SpoIIIE
MAETPDTAAAAAGDNGSREVQAAAYTQDAMRQVLGSLRDAAAARGSLERKIVDEFEKGCEATRQEADRLMDETVNRYDDKIAQSQQEFEEVKGQIETEHRRSMEKVQQQRGLKVRQIEQQSEQNKQQLQEDEQFAESTQTEGFKEKRSDPGRLAARDEKGLQTVEQELGQLRKKTLSILADRKITPPSAESLSADSHEPSDGPLPEGEESLKQAVKLCNDVQDSVKKLTVLRGAQVAFSASGLVVSLILSGIFAAVAAGLAAVLLPVDGGVRAAAVAGIATCVFGIGAAVGTVILSRTKKRVREESLQLFSQSEQDYRRATQAINVARGYLVSRREQQEAQLELAYHSEVERRKQRFAADMEKVANRREAEIKAVDEKVAAALQAAEEKRLRLLEEATAKYLPAIEKLSGQRSERMSTIESKRDERLVELEGRRARSWEEMVERWKAARVVAAETVERAVAYDTASFARWDRLANDTAAFASVAPVGIRFGDLSASMEDIRDGVSPHDELNGFGPCSWTQPSMIPFPTAASLLINSTAADSEVASEMLQAIMLRIATGIPPGQTRFTIIDPVGLGKHFAGFMHLADYDELLVTSRIWTEPTQIEQRLADITEQMELVIQKYLRNEYASIGEYNADAEVPEPYRFVVVANFPANFTETSARRLLSIASSGARCGVYTLVSVDRKQQLPSNFSLEELAKYATVLELDGGRFRWRDPEFAKWPLEVERSPSDELVTKIVHHVGQLAKAAKRVEVPFERVAPKEEDWWTGSTAEQIDVPLGPAGAKKMQHMKLGKGTSQHVLIAGKTGSGKSTMMHALITNLALTYSPNEVQFYLIDFKKGVEFKVYDHYDLPHARVIAIESEREFGLSVLQQLDRELKRRGDLFRDLAVQNLGGYRASGHPEPMPRVLLIIDEFQELFIEDDKLAQDASLVLDRLVRQGRAFGMHVLLGSQTLGGSYSLPRSTMGQMAVRIALQCNEADSSLILSEDNSAARLLTRPGEAIYNDANGVVEGNNPFQVVWLGDERRERYLGALQKLAAERTDIPPLPRIVFDGNEAADPAGNGLLSELLAKGTAESGPLDAKELAVSMAWLGDAIAIKDPTAAPFRRQGGSNLLIVGQRQDLAASLLAMSMIGLAAGHDPFPGGGLGRAARFVLFEPAIAEEHPETMLAQFAEKLPHRIECVSRLGVGDAVERIADEVQRRLDEQVLDAESVFVVVRDLARFRELRKADGDFGFSFGGEQKANPAQRFLDVLKDGPAVGVHTIVWCDSLTNLMRTFDRSGLKEFELRVLFQMSGSDSSQLVETPIASKLGPQRALFIHEETGTLEKFRPYAFPAGEWLTRAVDLMEGRPLGMPAEDPPPRKTPSKPAAEDGQTFNFTSFLDEPPAIERPAAGDDEGSGGPAEQS